MVGTVVYVGANQKASRNLDEVAGVFFKSMPRGQRIFLLADQGGSIYIIHNDAIFLIISLILFL